MMKVMVQALNIPELPTTVKAERELISELGQLQSFALFLEIRIFPIGINDHTFVSFQLLIKISCWQAIDHLI